MVHGGLQADVTLTQLPLVGPSTPVPPGGVPVQALGPKQLQSIVAAFVSAAQRSLDAGFDAIQLHVAHGYLLSEFLSPRVNRRTDAYGGSVENRVRIVCEITTRVRDEVSPDLPILVKMNGADFVAGGLEAHEAAEAAARMEAAGVDAIEVSGGTRDSGKQGAVRTDVCTIEDEAYFRKQAEVIRRATGVPLFLVGGIRSLETVEALVSEGVADGVALCRPLIREPALVQRWAAGDREPARCASCNRCFVPIRRGKGPVCLKER